MKCYVCGETLRGAYFTYKNQPICEKDYKVGFINCLHSEMIGTVIFKCKFDFLLYKIVTRWVLLIAYM
jgi:hypothetical protein